MTERDDGRSVALRLRFTGNGRLLDRFVGELESAGLHVETDSYPVRLTESRGAEHLAGEAIEALAIYLLTRSKGDVPAVVEAARDVVERFRQRYPRATFEADGGEGFDTWSARDG